MKNHLILLVSLLFIAYVTEISSQMSSVVNSLADDEFAYPHDKQATPFFDESVDGICEDSLGRCTFRAAIDEASNIGQSAFVSFLASLSGNLVVDDMLGPFAPPDNSVIQGVQQKVIFYGSNFNSSALLTLGNSITVTGLGFANGLIGIVVEGENNLIGSSQDPVHSNYFHHFSQNGILITGNGNSIKGNRIGIAYDNTPIGNKYGIFITGSSNLIGGDQEEGNIISGNEIGVGIYTLDGSTLIYGNKIGTDSAGTHAVANRVGIDNIGPNVFIGNDTPEGMNVISGNTESGILFGLDASSCSIRQNNIGTDISGTISIPNRDGITLGPGTDTCAVHHNLIKFNTNNGILVSGINVPELITQHNLISGNTIQQNGNAGIAFTGTANDNVVGSSLTTNNEPNEISYNGQIGVVFAPSNGNPQRNTIRDNYFLDNTSYGIRIISGQGGIQPPVFESYTDDGSTAIVIGTHSLAGAIIDLYAGDVNQGNRLEGIEWLGSGPVDASGFFSIQISSCICDSIVATATDAIGNTSQFSDGLGTITALHDPSDLAHAIKANPNPFNEKVHISFELTHPGEVDLEIYDLDGRRIKTLIDGSLPAGAHLTGWIPDSNPPGIYYYQLIFGNRHVTTGKMIYLE